MTCNIVIFITYCYCIIKKKTDDMQCCSKYILYFCVIQSLKPRKRLYVIPVR